MSDDSTNILDLLERNAPMRMLIKLKKGEQPDPPSMYEPDPPKGFRREKDAEFRERLLKKIENDAVEYLKSSPS